MNEQPKPARVLPKLDQFPGRTMDVIRFGDVRVRFLDAGRVFDILRGKE